MNNNRFSGKYRVNIKHSTQNASFNVRANEEQRRLSAEKEHLRQQQEYQKDVRRAVDALQNLTKGKAGDFDTILIHDLIQLERIGISEDYRYLILRQVAGENSADDFQFHIKEHLVCNYVIDRTNDVYMALAKTDNENALQETAQIGIATINKLLDDKDFLRVVVKLSELQSKNIHESISIVDEIDNFTNVFTTWEWRLLMMSGIEREMADELIEQAKSLRESIKSGISSGAGILGKLRKLRSQLLYVLQISQDHNRKVQELAAKKIITRRIVHGIGGITTVVVNATLGTMFLGPAGSAVSSVLGGILIENSITDA